MNKKQIHHIQKQQVMLDFAKEETARYWNRRFSEFYFSDILPPLNSLLDTYIPEDSPCVIDRLEIDLGRIHIDDFQTAFLSITEAELKRILIHKSATGSAKAIAAIQADHKKREVNLKVKENREHLLEILFYFLDRGVLPWNSEFNKIDGLELNIRREIGFDNLSGEPGFQKRMLTVIARKRLWFQFSRSFSYEVFNRLFSNEQVLLSSLQKDLVKILIPFAKAVSAGEKIKLELSDGIWNRVIEEGPADSQYWPRYFIISSIERISAYIKPVLKKSLFNSILKKLPPSSLLAVHLKELIVTFKEETGVEIGKFSSYRGETRQIDERYAISKKNRRIKSDRPGPAPSASEHIDQTGKKQVNPEFHGKSPSIGRKSGERPKTKKSNAEESKRSTERSLDPQKSKKTERPDTGNLKSGELPPFTGSDVFLNEQPGIVKQQTSDIDHHRYPDLNESIEEYYPRHSGVILVWPYMAKLFKHLEYLEENTFKGLRHQQRAVHLLGYIASGADQCEEHELVLAKFLCAWPLQMPVIKELELSDEEKSSADQMLNSLISHWSVLKNTSIGALRQSFFVRDGKLFNDDGQWRLIVEQKSYDMLLDRLPFSVALIRFPWMENILKVDWV